MCSYGAIAQPGNRASGEQDERENERTRCDVWEELMPLLSQVPITTIIDYLGVMIGVIAGTLYAIDRKMDTLGAAALGIVTGFGGGIIRDLLLQDQGIFFMEHPLVILAGICLSVVLSLLRRYLPDFYKHLFYIDAFLMAWYVLAGAAKTWFAGAGPVITVILGSVTAVGGGAMRDICTGDIPKVFLPGKFYGISSVFGGIAYIVPLELGLGQDVASVLCVAVGFGLTVLSEHFGWHTHGGLDSSCDECEECD